MAVRESFELDFSSALSGLTTLDRRFTETANRFSQSVDRAFAKVQSGATAFTIDGKVNLDGAEEADKDLEKLDRQTEETAQGLDRLGRASKDSDANLEKVGHTAALVGGAIVAGLALGEKAIIGFDQSISNVAAVSGATADELGKLRDAAIEAGAATVFSASEAADAEGELARAGLTASDILGGGLTGALDLAAAGQLGLADAATIAAQAMQIFNLPASEVGHIADVLAAGANKSTASVASLGEGLGNVGGAARLAGLTLEETVGVLALLDQNAIKGAEGGTALKSALLALFTPTKQQTEALHRYNIEVFDAQGKFVGLAGLAENLKTSLGGLTDAERNAALGVIFGSFGIQAAAALYKSGKAGVDDYTKAVNDQGAAARVSGIQLNNLGGDLEQLSGSIETAIIKGGSGATDVLRTLAQAATDSVNAFGNLPPVTSGFAAGLLGIVGAGTLTLGIAGSLIPKFREVRGALLEGGEGAQFLGRNLGNIGRAAAGLGVFFAALGPLQQATDNMTEAGIAAGTLAGTIIAPGFGTLAGAAIGGLAGQFGLLGDNIDKTAETTKKLRAELQGLSVDQITRQFKDLPAALALGITSFADVRKQVRLLATESPADAEHFVKALKGIRDETGKPLFDKAQIADLEAALGRGIGVYQRIQGETKKTTDRNNELKGSLEPLPPATEEVAKGFEAATEQLGGYNAAALQAAGVSDEVLGTLADQAEEFSKAVSGSVESATNAFAHDFSAKIEAAKPVSEQAMIDFLEGSSNQIIEWSTKIRDLVERGVDVGIVQEIAQAGPKATPQLDAFIKVVDDKGVEYVNTIAQHNRDAVADTEDAFRKQVVSAAIHLAEMNTIVNAITADAAAGGHQNLINLANNAEGEFKRMAFEALVQLGVIQTGLDNLPDTVPIDVIINAAPGSGVAIAPNGDIVFDPNQFPQNRQSGGPVPGGIGQPVPLIAHGGEFVLSADVVQAIKAGGPTEGLGNTITASSPSTGGSLIGTLIVQGEVPNGVRVARATAQRLRLFASVGP